MEFALKYGIWELLRHEQILETHVLAILETGIPGCLMNIKYQQVITEFFRFLEVCVSQG